MKNSSSKVAKVIGHSLAHLQDGIDFFADAGFKALKKVGEAKEKRLKKDGNKYAYAAKKGGKEVLKFLGMAGDEFYNKYEELKSDRKKK